MSDQNKYEISTKGKDFLTERLADPDVDTVVLAVNRLMGTVETSESADPILGGSISALGRVADQVFRFIDPQEFVTFSYQTQEVLDATSRLIEDVFEDKLGPRAREHASILARLQGAPDRIYQLGSMLAHDPSAFTEGQVEALRSASLAVSTVACDTLIGAAQGNHPFSKGKRNGLVLRTEEKLCKRLAGKKTLRSVAQSIPVELL